MMLEINNKQFEISDKIAEKYIKYVGPLEDMWLNIDVDEVKSEEELEKLMIDEINTMMEIPLAVTTYAKENNYA